MSLDFTLVSGATLSIDTTRCPTCESKACLKVCAEQSPGPVLVLGEDGRPRLGPALAEIRRGVCTECLGCLLECEVRGTNAVRFRVPPEGLDAYVGAEEAAGRAPVYRR